MHHTSVNYATESIRVHSLKIVMPCIYVAHIVFRVYEPRLLSISSFAFLFGFSIVRRFSSAAATVVPSPFQLQPTNMNMHAACSVHENLKSRKRKNRSEINTNEIQQTTNECRATKAQL